MKFKDIAFRGGSTQNCDMSNSIEQLQKLVDAQQQKRIKVVKRKIVWRIFGERKKLRNAGGELTRK